MRELYRTDEGTAAWRSPSTDAQSRRLLGALVQAQPEEHLKLVLGGEGEILLESLLRRGWVSWRQVAAPEEVDIQPDQKGVSPSPPPNQDTAQQAEQKSATHGQDYPPAAHNSLPPVKAPPSVSREEIDNSLADFFRKMGTHK